MYLRDLLLRGGRVVKLSDKTVQHCLLPFIAGGFCVIFESVYLKGDEERKGREEEDAREGLTPPPQYSALGAPLRTGKQQRGARGTVDMLRSIGKQSEESVESVQEKKT